MGAWYGGLRVLLGDGLMLPNLEGISRRYREIRSTMNGFYHYAIKKADDSNRGTYLEGGGNCSQSEGTEISENLGPRIYRIEVNYFTPFYIYH